MPAITGKARHAVARHRGDDPAGRDLADAVVPAVRDEQVTLAVRRHTKRRQSRAGGQPAITGKVRRAVARHRGDNPVWGDPADAVVANVRDEQVARTVHRQPSRKVQSSGCGWPAITKEETARRAISGHRGDNPTGGYLAEAVVVRDEQVARTVHRHASGKAQFQFSGCCGSAITREAWRAGARHRGDNTVWGDPADAVGLAQQVGRGVVEQSNLVVVNVRNEQVTRGVHGYTPRRQCRAGGWPAITGRTRHAIARHRGDDPAWRDLADAAAEVIRDEHVAAAVHRYATRRR